MKGKRLWLAGLIIVISFSTQACWDRIELEERGLVVAVAVDVVEESQSSGQQLRVTVLFPTLLKDGGQSAGGMASAGGSSQPPVQLISGTGGSVFGTIREMARETSRILFFGHLQSLVISEEAARQGIEGIIDWFERDSEPGRRAKLIISQGKASSVISFTPHTENYVGQFLKEVIRQDGKLSRTRDSWIQEFINELRQTGTSLVPRVEQRNGAVRTCGTAVFRGFKMVGTLDETETRGILWLRNLVQGGVVEVTDPNLPDMKVVYEIADSRTRLKHEIINGLPVFHVELEIEGDITEAPRSRTLRKEFINKIQIEVARTIEDEVNRAVKKTQELKADVADLGEYLRRHHPSYWRTVEKDWQQSVYPRLQLEVRPKVLVRRTGISG